MLRALAIAIFASVALTSAAQACMGYNLHEGIVFDTIPEDAPADALVLRVEFDPAEVQRIGGPNATEHNAETWLVMSRVAMEARVLEVVRGEFSSATVSVDIGGSSCDTPFIFGISGLIIGQMVSPAEGQARYDAWHASLPAPTPGASDGVLTAPARRPSWPFDETVFVPLNETPDDRLERHRAMAGHR
jgi:hypothetical protein